MDILRDSIEELQQSDIDNREQVINDVLYKMNDWNFDNHMIVIEVTDILSELTIDNIDSVVEELEVILNEIGE